MCGRNSRAAVARARPDCAVQRSQLLNKDEMLLSALESERYFRATHSDVGLLWGRRCRWRQRRRRQQRRPPTPSGRLNARARHSHTRANLRTVIHTCAAPAHRSPAAPEKCAHTLAAQFSHAPHPGNAPTPPGSLTWKGSQCVAAGGGGGPILLHFSRLPEAKAEK